VFVLWCVMGSFCCGIWAIFQLLSWGVLWIALWAVFWGDSCGGIRAVLQVTGSMAFLWMVAWTVSLTV